MLTTFRYGADIPDGMGKALPDFEKLRPFDWELEFPEVFLKKSLQKMMLHQRNYLVSIGYK
ncbi:MAG: hypothetical protein V7K55_25560 [Nostoc sp.]|uniref:hypothetical protein n=1 Tax=Nostoc sp. TaxID=1180 RepID=UPI002FFACE4F